MEIVTDFMFMGSKIIADNYRSYEIERYLLLGRKAVTNLDSTSKSRDITLLTKIHMVKAVVFPVVRRTVKIAEHQRIEALNCGAGEDS